MQCKNVKLMNQEVNRKKLLHILLLSKETLSACNKYIHTFIYFNSVKKQHLFYDSRYKFGL